MACEFMMNETEGSLVDALKGEPMDTQDTDDAINNERLAIGNTLLARFCSTSCWSICHMEDLPHSQ